MEVEGKEEQGWIRVNIFPRRFATYCAILIAL